MALKRKYYLRITFFLVAIKTSVLSKFTSMQDLQNNNWIIIDPLENIYEISTNLTVMNLNHF